LNQKEPTVQEIAAAIADAWTIIDSAHRFSDLVENLPGLPNSDWRKLLNIRLKETRGLRNCVQHQIGEIDGLIQNEGQIWGYLSWAQIRDGRYTGLWLMISPGADYTSDKWVVAGPNTLPFPVPPGRIRLNAFSRQVYLGRIIGFIREGILALEAELESNRVRPRGQAAAIRSGTDRVIMAGMLVEYEVPFDNNE